LQFGDFLLCQATKEPQLDQFLQSTVDLVEFVQGSLQVQQLLASVGLRGECIGKRTVLVVSATLMRVLLKAFCASDRSFQICITLESHS